MPGIAALHRGAQPPQRSGVAIGDYNNDGCPDIFVVGVYHNTLYRNNCNETFTDVTRQAGLANRVDPKYGPLWSEAAAWVDVNNDGRLDLFIVNYMRWKYTDKPRCSYRGVADYCSPRYYAPVPDQLYLNNGNGTFTDVSKSWGLRENPGKGMGVGVADYDLDGRQDLFVTNDSSYNFLFHNLGNKFEEVAFQAGVALPQDGDFASEMGLDFRDINNDGYPDIGYVALNNQTFPLYLDNHKGGFTDITASSGMRALSMHMAGYCAGFYDFDNDGWKDLTQYNHMTTSVGYASSSDGPAHFGLGSDTSADIVKIWWPSGIIQTLHNVEGDRVVRVTEPDN